MPNADLSLHAYVHIHRHTTHTYMHIHRHTYVHIDTHTCTYIDTQHTQTHHRYSVSELIDLEGGTKSIALHVYVSSINYEKKIIQLNIEIKGSGTNLRSRPPSLTYEEGTWQRKQNVHILPEGLGFTGSSPTIFLSS